MASPPNRRTERQRDEPDLDALFAPEPDEAPKPRADPPTLIFTQPADRNVQQFADEPVQFADEPVQFAEEPVKFVEQADPLSLPLLPSPAHPYHARWNESEPPIGDRWGIVLGLVAFAGVIAVAATVLVPREEADFGQAVSAAQPRPAAAPPPVAPDAPQAASETPAATRPPADPPSAASAAPAPRSRPESPVAAARLEPPRTARRESPTTIARETAGPAATSGRVASEEPPVAARGVTSEPPAPPPPAAPPVADIRRPDTERAAVIGQPLGPPRELPAAPVSRGASPEPRVEPSPAATVPTAPAPGPAVDPRAAESDRVRAVLSGYERAYSDLDADAASRVFPAVDRKALSRAFSGLSAQQIRFDACRIEFRQASARATCAGTARWTPKVGGGTQQQARRWQFDLEQVPGGWRIGSVKVQ